MHLTETLILNDTTTASDDESDKGTEDTAGPVDTPTSDTEKDTFKDTSNVTGNLKLKVNLHSTEKVTAADGTVTETDVDLGDQDNVQDKEKDTLADKHTNNAFPPSQGGGRGGSAGGLLEDDVTFDDESTDTENDTGSDGVTVSTFGPIANDPNHPQPAGSTAEDDDTSNEQDEETLDGQDKSTETIGVTGTTPDGTTVNSTEVLGSKVTADADTDDDETITGVDLQLTDGNTTDSLQTTDKMSDEADTTDNRS